MKLTMRTAAALGVAAMLSLASLPAMADGVSLGKWQTDDHKMDVAISLCGPDGTSICGLLVGLHGSADTKKNRKFLNKHFIQDVRANGKNRWRGLVTVENVTAQGTIQLIPGKALIVRGCAYGLACKHLTLHPIS